MKSLRTNSSGRGRGGGGGGGAVSPLCLFRGSSAASLTPAAAAAQPSGSSSSSGFGRRRNSVSSSSSLLHTPMAHVASCSSAEPYPPGFVPTRTRGHLYVGSLLHALDETFISSSNVRFVVTAALPYGLWPQQQRLLYIRLGVDHTILPLLDSPQQLLDFAALPLPRMHFQLTRGRTVFVHCEKGISRSVSVCLAYLILFDNHSLASALEAIRQHRPIARPNIGFLLQLQRLEQLAARKRWNVAPLLLSPLPSAAASYAAGLRRDSPCAAYSSSFSFSSPPSPPAVAPSSASSAASASSSSLALVPAGAAAAPAAATASASGVTALPPAAASSSSSSSSSADHLLVATAAGACSAASSASPAAAATDAAPAARGHRVSNSSTCSGRTTSSSRACGSSSSGGRLDRSSSSSASPGDRWSTRQQRRSSSSDRRRGRSNSSSKEAYGRNKACAGRSSSAYASFKRGVSGAAPGARDGAFSPPVAATFSCKLAPAAAAPPAAVATSRPSGPVGVASRAAAPAVAAAAAAPVSSPAPAAAAVYSAAAPAAAAAGPALLPPPGCFLPLPRAAAAAPRLAAAAAAGSSLPGPAGSPVARAAALPSSSHGAFSHRPYATPFPLLPPQQRSRLAMSYCYSREAAAATSSPRAALHVPVPSAATSPPFCLSPAGAALAREPVGGPEAVAAPPAPLALPRTSAARAPTGIGREIESCVYRTAAGTAGETRGQEGPPTGAGEEALRGMLLRHAAVFAAAARERAAAAATARTGTHRIFIRSREEEEKEVEKEIAALQQRLARCGRYTSSRAR